MNHPSIHALLTIAILQGALPSLAAAEELPASVLACRAEKDDARRLSCFDREIGRYSSQSPENGAAPPARIAEPPSGTSTANAAPAVVPAATPSPQAEFGFVGGTAPEERARKQAAANPPTQLQATVTGISRRGYGELIVTLDNSQVWAELAHDPDFDLGVNDKVTIKRAMLGSFLMINPDKRSTRVKRLR